MTGMSFNRYNLISVYQMQGSEKKKKKIKQNKNNLLTLNETFKITMTGSSSHCYVYLM